MWPGLKCIQDNEAGMLQKKKKRLASLAIKWGEGAQSTFQIDLVQERRHCLSRRQGRESSSG